MSPNICYAWNTNNNSKTLRGISKYSTSKYDISYRIGSYDEKSTVYSTQQNFVIAKSVKQHRKNVFSINKDNVNVTICVDALKCVCRNVYSFNLLKNIIEASQALPFLCLFLSVSVCHIETIFGDLFEQTIVYFFQFIFHWIATNKR